jgi:hypothetical protein
VFRWSRKQWDLRDIYVAAGAVALYVGIGEAWPPGRWVAVGALLVYIGLWHGLLTAVILRNANKG